MERRRLGAGGPDVSVLSLGTMMFGRWGNPDEAQCTAMVDQALEAGVNLFDTADIYDFGRSEEILGAALRGRRDGVYVATKCGNPMSDDPAERGLSARWVRAECEASLRRLQVDHIDLYQCHRPDPDTPIAETLGELQRLHDEGKIGAVGTSTFSPAQLAEANQVARDHGLVVPTSEQPPYSALVRAVETEVLPLCAARAVGVVCWAPLNGGWLTGKYQHDVPETESRARREPDHFDHRDALMRQTKRDLVARLTEVADGAGLTLVQLALGFVVSHPAVTSAIIGPRTPAQCAELLAAGAARLPDDVLAAIDAIVPPGHTVNPVDNG